MKTIVIEQGFKVLTLESVYSAFAKDTEKYGRVCYKSEGKIVNGKRKKITNESAESFIKRIITNGHESVLEHCNLTIKFIVDRAIANALVRHRHCAFSQESTHYINYLKKDSISVIKQFSFLEEELHSEASKIIDIYAGNKEILPSMRRALLPLCLKTELVMTTNIREWRHILKIRTQSGCHIQMRHLMTGVLNWFKDNLSIFVIDL